MGNKKIALITGGTRGIGLALVKKLVAKNYEVWATYRNNVDVLEKYGAKGLYFDLNQVDSIAEFVDCVNQKMPHLDVLIHNAALSATHDDLLIEQKNLEFGKLESSGLEKMLRINAIVPVLLSQALVSLLKTSRNPKILMLSSRKGALSLVKKGGNYGYKGSKALLNMWSMLLAEDLRSLNICVCAVNPGHVRTTMGGKDAPLSPKESAEGLYHLMDNLTMKQSGQFLHLNSSKHPL